MTEMAVMEKLERRMQQTLVKVYERVSRITEIEVIQKLKKMQQHRTEVSQRASKMTEEAAVKTPEQVQQALREVDEQVLNALLDELNHGCRVRALPPPREDGSISLPSSVSLLEGGGHSPGEELDDAPAPALKDGDSHGELDEARPARALRMDIASCYVQDHDEDSHFVDTEAGIVRVADGIGALRKKGVDAGAFARALMSNASAGAKRAAAKRGRPVCPYTLLRKAYNKAALSRAPGASTAVIVSLDGTTLRWAYVGDSCLAVLRGGRIVHRSSPQRHRFNCPFQLSAKGGDRVTDAEVGDVPVMKGDVVVVGTDGLFDNMFDAEVERVVQTGTVLGWSPQNMADSITAVACEMSRRRLAHSPFSLESWRDGNEGEKRFYGGKVDDITVIVAFIVQSDCDILM